MPTPTAKPTHAEPTSAPPSNSPAAKATLFELRAALNDYELRGEPPRDALIDAISRIPANNAWPELERAQATLSEDSPRT